MSMYDVVYIDAHGDETPVAQQLDDRKDAADVARQAAAERGAGRMVLPGIEPAAQLRLRRSRCRPPKPRSRRHSTAAAASGREPLGCCAMRVGVIGGGLMGSGIAEVCARSGVDVTVVEADDERAERSRAAIERRWTRACAPAS